MYFQLASDIPAGNKYEFSLVSNQPIDVWVGAGDSEPTKFNHDFEFLGRTSVKLSLASLPQLNTFVAAVRINGVQPNGNIFNSIQLTAKFTVVAIPPMAALNYSNFEALSALNLAQKSPE